MPRQEKFAVRFRSGDDDCRGWLYEGTNGAAVVMATGAGITKEPGADRFAERFAAAGYTVLTFDYRNFGDSGGRPRQVLRVSRQIDDLTAAVAYAADLPSVEPNRVVVWGFSLGGGHVLQAAPDLPVAAAIAQTPFTDGLVATPKAIRHETLRVVMSVPLLTVRDLLRGLFGRSPYLVPLAAPKGKVALLTTPDAQMGDEALRGSDYPEWEQTIAARSILPLSWYRPGRRAGQITCPLLVVVANDDQSVLARPAVEVAQRAPHAELVRVDGGHYAPFLDQFERVADAEVRFMDRCLAARDAAAASDAQP